MFNIGKTQAANVITNELHLRADYENFEGERYKHVKRGKQKYKPINLYSWSKKCENSGVSVTGLLLKEEAMNIKATFHKPELENFKALDCWLDILKLTVFEKNKYQENP